MSESIRLEKRLLSEKRRFTEDFLNKKGFQAMLQGLDRHRYIASPQASNLYQVVENAFTIFLGMQEKLSEYLDSSEDKELKRFINLFSSFGGALYVEEKMNNFHDEDSLPEIDLEIRYCERIEILFEEIVSIYTNYVEEEMSKDFKERQIKNIRDLSILTEAYFRGLKEAAIKESKKYEGYIDKVRNLNLEFVDDFIISGFESVNGKHRKIEDVNWEDIIGNGEVKKKLVKLARVLFLYNPETRINPYKEIAEVPRTLLMEGPPGTGKTTIIKALINHMKHLSELTNRKFEYVQITSKMESKWLGESVKNLDSMLQKGLDPNYVGVVVIEDIDGIIARRDDTSSSTAERKILTHLMNVIEGVDSYDLGNNIIISTTNYKKKLDKALVGRISQKQYNVEGPKTEEEYIEIYKLHLKKGIGYGYINISEEEWEVIGEQSKEKGFTGRDIRNICVSYIDEVTDVEFEDSLYSLELSVQKEELLSIFGTVRVDKLLNEIDKYSLSKEELI